jgi:hypothetical protein
MKYYAIIDLDSSTKIAGYDHIVAEELFNNKPLEVPLDIFAAYDSLTYWCGSAFDIKDAISQFYYKKVVYYDNYYLFHTIFIAVSYFDESKAKIVAKLVKFTPCVDFELLFQEEN